MTARALILTYVALVALAVASWLLASAGTGTAVALLIASVKALLIALVFMELWRAHAVDRIVAAVAVLFVILLCAGALADVAFR
jgi:caa(3)-type oxidase subunit IV